MDDPDKLTPEQARAKFGKLVVPPGVHQEFEVPEGIWKPKFGPGMTLEEYRLWKPVKTAAKVRPPFRPKGKR